MTETEITVIQRQTILYYSRRNEEYRKEWVS